MDDSGAQDTDDNQLNGWLGRLKARITSPIGLLLYRIVVVSIGALLIVAGIIMLVIPGPGIVAILLGLAVLGTEFRSIRRITSSIRSWIRRTWRRSRNDGPGASASGQ